MNAGMTATAFPEINALLDHLLREIQAILGPKLVGLYLTGSLVMGDFDPAISDIDLLAAMASDIDDQDAETLRAMHDAFVRRYREWDGRIEVAYISVTGLQTFRTHSSKLGIISPGEPFHVIEAGSLWLVNWYPVRERGLALFGPPSGAVIAPISRKEYIEAVMAQTRAWSEWIHEFPTRRPALAYAILTLCRALYTYEHGEQASKIRAAAWAMQELPEWSSLIQRALKWREAWRSDDMDDDAAFHETEQFVYFAIAWIGGTCPRRS
jgi:Domain of unknown function (DUF4111)